MVRPATRAISNEELCEMLPAILGRLPEPRLTRENTAILVIDVQYFCAHPDYGVGARAKQHGWDGRESFHSRLKELVVPNIQRLLARARKAGIEVIHVRIAPQTGDGRDNSSHFKVRGIAFSRDSVDAQILPEVAPQGDELVISKTTSSVFNSTNIDRLLRNLGITNLIIAGVTTNGCVESSTFSAHEYDYGTIVVEDATGAVVPQLHDNAVLNMKHQQVAFFKSTEEVIKLLEEL